MANYSDADYWNDRYEKEEDYPFDWLFGYAEVSPTIHHLLPDKNAKILMLGAGNAPFSPDLYIEGHYNKIVNIDLSSVVIDQMSQKYPQLIWKTMNALNMDFEDASFPVVIDKSLIDTLLCASQSMKKVAAMVEEAHRVLQPGGRFIVFSLHTIEEIVNFYDRPEYNWKVSSFRLRSDRWNETEHRKRTVAHAMLVCDKPRLLDGSYPGDDPEEEITNENAISSQAEVGAGVMVGAETEAGSGEGGKEEGGGTKNGAKDDNNVEAMSDDAVAQLVQSAFENGDEETKLSAIRKALRGTQAAMEIQKSAGVKTKYSYSLQSVPGTLSEEEYTRMKDYADQVRYVPNWFHVSISSNISEFASVIGQEFSAAQENLHLMRCPERNLRDISK